MTRLLPLSALVLLALPAGCPKQEVHPLVGEPPEVYRIIGERPADDPLSSPVGAARRLHQALIQGDTDLAWNLLARPTRLALDERGALIGVSGRELLDSSTLPGPGGVVKKVRWEVILFGPDVVDLTAGGAPSADDRQAVVRAVGETGRVTERTFVRTEEGWKLSMQDLPTP
ncbi:MAG: hypothetical protein ACQEXJ_17750 [Myxococcota bacterium]